MRGARLKKLKRMFRETHGRSARGVHVVGEQDGGQIYVPSEIRRVKKIYKEHVRDGLRTK